MKKLLTIIIALLVLASALVFTGCGGKESVTVSSELKLSDSFNGTRVVTVRYPLSADIDAIKDAIMAGDPSLKNEAEGVTFTYKGVEDDGYCFELVFDFTDREDYEREVKAVIGRTASSYLSRKDTVLTKGIRMKENFGVEDLISWMVIATGADSSTHDMDFDYAVNTVVVGGETYSTGTTVDISEITGSTVNSITIKTANDKQERFSRTFEFAIPNGEYLAAKDAIEEYFLSNTAPAAKYHGWSSDGTSQVYQVIFEDLTKRDLNRYTAMLMDTDSVSIDYGDADNTSTPLSEAVVFDEIFDTFSFIGPDRGAPVLHYSYVLPTGTLHGDGAVFEDGKWTAAGEWIDGAYQVELNTGSVHLRIPDGVQYTVEGIDFYLESLGGERFRRTADFLYSKRDGRTGRDYAVSFFTGKGAQASSAEDSEHLICSVVCEGTTGELTRELGSIFGSGNLVAYRKSSGGLSLSTKTTFTDYIDLSAILNGSNAAQPMRYFISASGAENIVSVLMDGSEKAYTSQQESYVTLNGGVGTVEYYGSIPITSHVILYVIFGLVLLGATVAGAYLMLRPRPGLSKGTKDVMDSAGISEEELAALTQTTTFSIAELGVLSRNKRYVDEINKDIEERIESDRLDRRKKEIRQKELAEMERKVYGTGDTSPLDEVPELNIDALRIPSETSEASSAPETQPEPTEKPAPKPSPKPADPFSLLDDAPGEDEDA